MRFLSEFDFQKAATTLDSSIDGARITLDSENAQLQEDCSEYICFSRPDSTFRGGGGARYKSNLVAHSYFHFETLLYFI